jgi:hypothetical protein
MVNLRSTPSVQFLHSNPRLGRADRGKREASEGPTRLRNGRGLRRFPKYRTDGLYLGDLLTWGFPGAHPEERGGVGPTVRHLMQDVEEAASENAPKRRIVHKVNETTLTMSSLVPTPPWTPYNRGRSVAPGFVAVWGGVP